MSTTLLVIHLIIAVALVGIVLLQRSEGGGLGIGGGGDFLSGRHSGNFLTHMTAVLATLFMVFSMVLTLTSQSRRDVPSIIDVEDQEEIPVLPPLPSDRLPPLIPSSEPTAPIR
ncbi:MAG: preprotein translocase subunit SecG [Alphaproteobacteria bacterium GM7ARS4]|nr:preprotein translocase subunit SecG [Alphaproteobacteria bacterium GM7ARS4]